MRVLLRKVCFTLFLTIISSSSLANEDESHPFPSCQGNNYEEQVVTPDAKEIAAKAIIPAIKFDLEMSSFVAGRLLACAKDPIDLVWFEKHMNYEWFQIRYTDNDGKWENAIRKNCPKWIANTKKIIAENYPKMRNYLTHTSGTHLVRDYIPGSYAYNNILYPEAIDYRFLVRSPGRETLMVKSEFFDPWINTKPQHFYPGLVDLSELSNQEIINALEFHNSKLKQYWHDNQDMAMLRAKSNTRDNSEVLNHNSVYFHEMRKEFDEKYKALLAAFPILGFVTSANPPPHEIQEALEKMAKKNDDQLEQLKDDFYEEGQFNYNKKYDSQYTTVSYHLQDSLQEYFIYKSSIDRVLNFRSDLCDISKTIYGEYESSSGVKTFIATGLPSIGILGCFYVTKGPLRDKCFTLLGIGAAMMSVGVAEIRYKHAFESAFASPSGYQVLMELDQLGEHNSERVFAWLFAPLDLIAPAYVAVKKARKFSPKLRKFIMEHMPSQN